MSEELAEIIREEIRQKGPIPFSTWMDLCLYHPQYGYYMQARPPGRRITGPGADADFVTPPTLHPFFAKCIAKEIHAAWELQGRPAPFEVQEEGGGEGDLARIVLAWLDENAPLAGKAITWRHYDPSPFHRESQRSSDPRIDPRRTGDLHYRSYYRILCEVVDAMALDVVRRSRSSWEFLHVDAADDRFVETWKPIGQTPPDPYSRAPVDSDFAHDHPLRYLDPVPFPHDDAGWIAMRAAHKRQEAAWLKAAEPQDVPEGGRVQQQWRREYNLETLIGGAGAIIVDYGDRSRPLTRAHYGDAAVRGFRGHGLTRSVLETPGDQDITASVDFSMTRLVAEASGLREASFETMEQFLLRHGILDELNRIDRSTVEGASSYLRLRQLLLPTGMGTAFKVQRFDREPQSEPWPSAEALAYSKQLGQRRQESK